MKEYVTIKTEDLSSLEGRFSALSTVFPALKGAETYLADIRARELPLYSSEDELDILAEKLKKSGITRLHASYWASPSSFLCGINKDELYENFGGEKGVKEYYSDLTGDHLYDRWVQEYILAKKTDADAYVFHLIDYFPIDGMWRFTLTPQKVVDCMIQITQEFVKRLYDNGLIDVQSPVIELENAGWGLEYGIQSADDYRLLFEKVSDPQDKLRISWDINHLLHALGQKEGKGRFFLPRREITEEMRALEEKYSHDPSRFAAEWLRHNILNEKIRDKVNTIQLSDCVLKNEEYFTEGYLNYPHRDTLLSLSTWNERESFGENIVLTHYDSHVPLSKGILKGSHIREMIHALDESYEINILHELKNSKDLLSDLKFQREILYKGE